MHLAATLGAPFLLIGLAGLILSVWAIVDVVSRPEWAFRAAGSSKTLWLVLEIIGLFVCGLVFSLIYLLAIRPKVVSAAAFGPSGPGSQYGSYGSYGSYPPGSGWSPPPPPPPPGWSQPPPASQTPPGWYPDPDGSGRTRYWDGTGWTEQSH